MNLESYIQGHSQISISSISATLQLLSEDCTIPFIARYRKDKTGNLDEVAIEEISKLINKDNQAVLVDLGNGKHHIITKHDIISSIK